MITGSENITVNNNMWELVRRLDTRKPHNDHTIQAGGAGQKIGNYGELALMRLLELKGIPLESTSDIEGAPPVDIVVYGKGIDVKSKRRTQRINAKRDEAHIETRQQCFECDAYVFFSVYWPKGAERPVLVQPAGWILKQAFWRDATMVKKGEETSPSFFEKADAGKLVYSKLNPMPSFYDWVKVL